MFRFNWEPAKQALLKARRPYCGANKHQKWEFKCAGCGGWFIRKSVELDHIEPCGSLRGVSDIGPFLERLHPEIPEKYQILCKDKCHRRKTDLERQLKKAA